MSVRDRNYTLKKMTMKNDITFITTVGYVKSTASTRNKGKENEHTCFSITSDPYGEDTEQSVFFIYVTDPDLRHFSSQLRKGTKVFVAGEYHDKYAYLFETILHSQRIDAYTIQVVGKKARQV